MAGTGKRKPPEVRRQEIIEAAAAIGAERGLESVTVRDVAARASVAPGLIHHYFPSLDALLTESFGSWADGVLGQLRQNAEGMSPKVALALTVTHLYPEQRIWIDALTTAARFSQLRERARELSVDYLDHTVATIQAGVDLGMFTCDDPTHAAWRIILLLDGMVAMVHILELIEPEQVPLIVGPVVEDQLGLERGSFTELVQALSAQSASTPR